MCRMNAIEEKKSKQKTISFFPFFIRFHSHKRTEIEKKQKSVSQSCMPYAHAHASCASFMIIRYTVIIPSLLPRLRK